MHYFFADETKNNAAGFLGIGILAVRQESFDKNLDHARAVSAARAPADLLEATADFLEKVDGLGMLYPARFDPARVFRAEAYDLVGIGRIARPNLIWGHLVALAIASTAGELAARGIPVKTVDVFIDPQALTTAHREALDWSIRSELPAIGREEFDKLGFGYNLKDFRIGLVESVPKPKEAPDKFQWGVRCADRLCDIMRERPSGDSRRRIWWRDFGRYAADVLDRLDSPEFRRSLAPNSPSGPSPGRGLHERNGLESELRRSPR